MCRASGIYYAGEIVFIFWCNYLDTRRHFKAFYVSTEFAVFTNRHLLDLVIQSRANQIRFYFLYDDKYLFNLLIGS